ncbi:hypothetical protein EDB86DRAFT_2907990, partial [Lactarius hatsudake]
LGPRVSALCCQWPSKCSGICGIQVNFEYREESRASCTGGMTCPSTSMKTVLKRNTFTPSLGGKATHPMEWATMTDPTPLQAIPEIVQPISRQLPSDSRRLCQWESATSKLLSKEYGEAMCAKQVVAQR